MCKNAKMKIDIKNTTKSEIEITGELAIADFDVFVQRSTKYHSAGIEVPGFRKGRAPEKKVIEKIGDDAILQKAAHLAMKDAYPKILKENNIEAIGHPDISITKLARGNALGFKIKTAVMPEITLPNYKEIAQKIINKKEEEIKIGEKEIQNTLDYLRKSRAPKDKPEELPELNDEFARSLGSDFKTLDDLKKSIESNLKMEKAMKAKEKKRMDVLEGIANETKIDLPEIMITMEKEKMVSELRGNIQNMGLKWEDYLKNIKKTEEEMKKEWTKDAEKRVKFGLVLRAIGDNEKIKISPDELNTHTERMLSAYPEADREKIDKDRVKEYANSLLRNEKIFQILEDKKEELKDKEANNN